MMTQTETIKAIRAMGLTCTVRDREYRITFPGLSRDRAEAIAYYTDDRQDAVITARVMIERGVM